MDNSVFRGIVAGKSNVRHLRRRPWAPAANQGHLFPCVTRKTSSTRPSRFSSRPNGAGRSCSIRPTAAASIRARSCSTSRLDVGDAAALRGFVRRRARPRRRGARLPADAGALPALLCRRQPRALRARSAHVRRPAALLRQYPVDAGRRRARHRRAGGRRRPGNLRPAHSGRRCHPAHREPLQALSPGAAAAVHARASEFRRGRAGRLPFHAVDRRRQGRAPARRHRARRPLRHELRAG